MTAFSNGSEYEEFASAFCYQCVYEPDCPLLEQVFCYDETPAEFVPNRRMRRYDCTQFKPHRPDMNRVNDLVDAVIPALIEENEKANGCLSESVDPG